MNDNKKASPVLGEAENKIEIKPEFRDWYNEEVDRIDRLVEHSYDTSINYIKWITTGGLTLLGAMLLVLARYDGIRTQSNTVLLLCALTSSLLGILCGAIGLFGYVDVRRRMVQARKADIREFLQTDGRSVKTSTVRGKKLCDVCEKISYYAFGLAIVLFVAFMVIPAFK